MGVRHIKAWRLPDSSANSPSKARLNPEPSTPVNGAPRALVGRNCLLGSLNEYTFTCVSAISDHEAIVCSDTGTICYLDDSKGQQKLQVVKTVPFAVLAITTDHDSGTVWLAGRDRVIQKFSISELKPSSPQPSQNFTNIGAQRFPNSKIKKPAVVSMGIFSNYMVAVDSTRAIRVCPLDRIGQGPIESLAETSIPAHRDAVLGVEAVKQPNAYDANFFTWSCCGTVNFWNLQGKRLAIMNVDLEQLPGNSEDQNELKVLRAAEGMNTFFSGDRFGVIRFV